MLSSALKNLKEGAERMGLPSWNEICLLLAGGLAALALWSWLAGVTQVFTLAHRHVPTAPSTALLLLLTASAGFLLQRRPGPVTNRVTAAISFLVGGFGLFAALRPIFGWDSPLEIWLAGQPLNLGGIPVGQMAPVTGWVMVMLAAALVLRLPRFRPLPRLWRISQALAGLAALAAVVVLLCYYANLDWIRGRFGIPMAAWTALSILLLGLGLLARPATVQRWTEPARGYFLTSLLLALAVALLGALYLRNEQEEIRAEARELIKTVGDLKADQIAQWRRERFWDAKFFARAEFVARDARALINNPGEPAVKARLLEWLKLLKAEDRYSLVAVFDRNLAPIAAIPDLANEPLSSQRRELLTAALNTNQFFMADFHRARPGDRIHLDLLCPLREKADDPAFAVLMIQIDPQEYLYPFIQTWPTPSLTAETLLVRRDGDDVLFLNELRHRTNTALQLRIPLDPTSQLPAAMAALGKSGEFKGLDYRGEPVLAALRPVPDSPWRLVAKIDLAEIHAPLRQQAWLVLILTLGLAGLAGLAPRLAWQQQELAAERQRRLLAERVQHLMQGANDAILVMDEAGQIIEVNDRATEMYGRTHEELCRLSIRDLRASETLKDFDRQFSEVLAKGAIFFETLHRRRDGTDFAVEVSSRALTLAGERQVLSIIRDITQRKAHEAEIVRLNRLYATLSQVNQTVVHCATREELFQSICDIAIQFGKFRAAWIAWQEPEETAAKILAWRADLPDPPAALPVHAENCGLTAAILSSGRHLVNNHLASAEPSACQEAMRQWGIHSCAAFPLRLRGQVRGVLSLCATEPNFFNAEEVRLLEEVALDISYALDRFAAEEERRRAEAAVRESEERFRMLFENDLGGIAIHEIVADAQGRAVDYRFLAANPSFEKQTGLRVADILGRRVTEVIPGITDTNLIEIYGQVARTGQPATLDIYFAPLKRHFEINAFSMGSGRFATVFTDITERMEAEEARQRNAARFQSLAKILQYRPSTTQEFLDLALEEAIKLTRSKIGYIYFYHEDRKQFVLNTWSKDVMKECAIANPETCYELDKTGLWGEAVRQRQPLIINDFQAEHPLKKGYPEGHVRLRKYLTIPIFNGDQIVAVAAVANKERDYDAVDLEQLQLLMSGVWQAVERWKAVDALRARLEELQRWHEATLDREQRILELKRQVNELLAKAGQPIRYPSAAPDWPARLPRENAAPPAGDAGSSPPPTLAP